MNRTDLHEHPSTLADLIVGSDRQSAAHNPSPIFSRAQIVNVSLAIDALIVSASFFLCQFAYPLISVGVLNTGGSYTLVGVVAGLIYYLVARTRQGRSLDLRPRSIWSVLRKLLATFAIVIVLGYALKQAEIHSRLWLALSFAISFMMISMKNSIQNRLIRTGRLQGLVVEKVALFGEASITASLKNSFKKEYNDFLRVSIYDWGSGDEAASDSERGDLNRLIADGLDNKFDRIVFCSPPGEADQLKDIVDAISFLPARVQVCLAHAELQALQAQLLLSPGEILINIVDPPQEAWGGLAKRLMDVTLGSIFLVLSAPVMLLAAIAIKLTSSGPIFFRQRRHGWNHSVISVWKFRTMTVQEDGQVITQAVPNDVRVTRVGRFLRKSSIDELPQLFNVLSGEMSLVGPRPHALAHNVQYSRLIESYAYRHKVKPGITGWAQVKGLRGNSTDISKMVARAEADIWYIRNWSVLLDLKIVLMTPLALLLQGNAV